MFGKLAGENALKYANSNKFDEPNAIERSMHDETRRVSSLLKKKEGEMFFKIRDELKTIMDENVGIFRNEKKLTAALENIRYLQLRYKNVYVRNKSAIFNQELVNTIELEGMLDIAEAICISALARKESRGSHYRLDHLKRDDANWLKHTLVSYTQERPRIDHKPVNITMYEPMPREY